MKKIILIAALITPTVSQAGELYGNVDYIDGWKLPDGSYQTAVEFDLNEGWKTYWRTPGPAGIPPTFDWSGSQNIADVQIIWPTPIVFDSYGLLSIGYNGRTTLPVRITPIQSDAPVNVDLRLDFGVCSDICVPASARLVTNLTDDITKQSVPEIKAALSEGPIDGKSAGLQEVTCDLTPNSSGFNIRADMQFASNVNDNQLTVIEYANPEIWIDLAESSSNGKNLIAEAMMEYYGKGMLMLDRSNILITVLGGDRAVEISGCPAS